MILNLAGNALINQHGDINRTKEILKDTSLVEFIVCSDVFMTPSAKFADVLLPGVSFLEMNNLVTPWLQGNFFGSVNKVVEPLGECKFEYEWLCEIAKRIGKYEAFTEGHETLDDWVMDTYEKLRANVPQLPTYEQFKQEGIYRYPDLEPVIAFEQIVQKPVSGRFPTPSGKIEIFSKLLLHMENPEKIPAIPKYVAAPEGPGKNDKFPLQLMGYHTKRRCHSIHDNNEAMEVLDPMAVHMNTEDAKARSIEDGDIVEVFNARGRIILPAKVGNQIMKGVAAISQGAWYTPDENGVDQRGCINVLTSSETTPLAHGNPQHTNRVEIVKKYHNCV